MTQDSYQRFRTVWDTRSKAEAYRDERFSRSRRWRWTERRERSILAQFLSNLPEGALTLDVPCGAGRMIPLFRQAGVSFVGADVSPSMLALARKAFGPLCLLAADGLRLPFSEGSFQALVALRLFHRIKEEKVRVEMLREMARAVRGPLLVTYYARWNLRGIQRWIRRKDPGLSLGHIRREIRKAGLRISGGTPLRRWTQQQWFFTLERV